MFSKSKATSNSASSGPGVPSSHGTFSVVGPDVVVTGNLQAKGDLHIDGRIEGDVSCATLVLGESGHIAGSITAGEARISGEVNGSIDAKNLVITASARTSGDISYDSLKMEAGARTDGRLAHRAEPADQLKLVAAAE